MVNGTDADRVRFDASGELHHVGDFSKRILERLTFNAKRLLANDPETADVLIKLGTGQVGVRQMSAKEPFETFGSREDVVEVRLAVELNRRIETSEDVRQRMKDEFVYCELLFEGKLRTEGDALLLQNADAERDDSVFALVNDALVGRHRDSVADVVHQHVELQTFVGGLEHEILHAVDEHLGREWHVDVRMEIFGIRRVGVRTGVEAEVVGERLFVRKVSVEVPLFDGLIHRRRIVPTAQIQPGVDAENVVI